MKMNEEIDDDVLSYFRNDSDDDAIDSADELLDMLSTSKENNENTNPGKYLRGDNDNEDDEDTNAQIVALQAQIELLKSSKKSPPAAKSKKEGKNEKVHHDDISCKHGKPITRCFFCSNAAQTVAPVVKKSEDIKKSETTNQCDSNIPADIFSVLPTISGETSTELSKKRRLAHEEKLSKENENPRKKAKVGKDKVKDNLPRSIYPSHQEEVSTKGNLHLFAGIDVSKPIMSSTIFDERTKGRKLIKIAKIETTVKGHDIEGDWVTVGVVVKKVTQKKSSSGKNFCVWHLSDLCLGTENNVIGLFLFGECYTQHWKIQVGRVIALLNPNLMKQDEKFSNQQLAIKIDNPNKLMELGDSNQLGACKGNRKSDGRPCTMYVNKKYGDYCEYHVHAAFKKAKSGRMDLQSGGRAPRNKGNMLKNLKKEISGGVYHYGGKTITLHKEKDNSVAKGKNDSSNKGLKSIMGHQVRLQAAIEYNEMKLKREQEAKLSQKDATVSSFLRHNKTELLKLSTKKEDLVVKSCVEGVNNKSEKLTATPVVKQSRNELNLNMKNGNIVGKSHEHKVKQCDINFFDEKLSDEGKKISPKLKNSCKSNPVLGRGLKTNDLIEFSPDDDDFCYEKHTGEEPLVPNPTVLKKILPKNFTVEVKNKYNDKNMSVRSIQAKCTAISIVQANGPIELEDPNIVKKKSPKSLKNIEKMMGKCEESCVGKIQTNERKKSLLAGVLGRIDLNSEDGKKLLQQKSKHVGAVKLAEAEKEEKYFDSLEKKENMLEKMANTFEIKVTGIACRECQYLAESQSQLCRDLNHAVAKISNMVKRFFICKSCKLRCCSYNKLLPKKACTRCGESNYEKTSMVVQRQGPLLGGETLELRGREQKFLNSLF